MARTLLSRFAGIIALILVSASPAASATPDDFVRKISDKAFTSLGAADLSDADRVERFRVLLDEAFDLKRIGRFVLGVHWRRASDEQKTEFLSLFEKFIVQAYANRFRDLTDKKLVVMQARELTDKESLVISQIEIPGQQPVNVNWKVADMQGTFKIVDVTVEGVSMSVTQRDEFAAVIRQNGGQIDGLLNALRRKTAQ